MTYHDSENFLRLRSMIAKDQSTWDLSPNDVKAISWAIDALDVFSRKAAFANKQVGELRTCIKFLIGQKTGQRIEDVSELDVDNHLDELFRLQTAKVSSGQD